MNELTREESYRLGRSEYFNLSNKGLTLNQIVAKHSEGGILPFWLRYFQAGFYAATMLSDDEVDKRLNDMISAEPMPVYRVSQSAHSE